MHKLWTPDRFTAFFYIDQHLYTFSNLFQQRSQLNSISYVEKMSRIVKQNVGSNLFWVIVKKLSNTYKN